jgi:hypothetical protein
MSTENNPYLTVPDYGQLNQNFGAEKLYSGYSAPSAVSDLAAAAKAADLQTGARTPDKGKYVYDSKTGQYIWVPATAAAPVGLAASPAYQERGGPQGGSELGVNPWGGLSEAEKEGYLDANPLARGITDAITGAVNTAKNFSITSLLSSLFGPKDSGYNADALGTGVSTQSQDAATNAAVEGKAQALAKGMQAQQQKDAEEGFSKSQVQTAVNAAMEDAKSMNSIADDAESEGVALGPAATGGPTGGDTGTGDGRDSGHGDPSGNSGGEKNGGRIRMARGGLGDLGGYSDGGRLLRGPGDGVSDSIPANIGGKRPARLADGEFVVPARIVSELGNGSTDAGARKLYAMLDRIQAGRKKTVGKGKVAANSRASKHLPA